MKTKTQPFDIEALKREQKPFDPYYVAAVMSELLSRERGYPVKIILTPKDQESKGG